MRPERRRWHGPHLPWHWPHLPAPPDSGLSLTSRQSESEAGSKEEQGRGRNSLDPLTHPHGLASG